MFTLNFSTCLMGTHALTVAIRVKLLKKKLIGPKMAMFTNMQLLTEKHTYHCSVKARLSIAGKGCLPAKCPERPDGASNFLFNAGSYQTYLLFWTISMSMGYF